MSRQADSAWARPDSVVDPRGDSSLGLPLGMGHRMLTIEEVAGWFRVPVATIRGWVRRRTIPYRKVGQVLRFPEAELEAWTVPPPSPQVGREVPLFAPNQVPSRPPPSVKLDISYD
jgi:excisionase family DNA binding protein